MHRLNADTYFCINADDRLELQVRARWRDLEMTVYKEDEDGGIYCRNLYSSMCYGGYFVAFPGEKGRFGETEKLEEWAEAERLPVTGGCVTETEMELISKRLGDFRYVLRKWQARQRIPRSQVLEAYSVWKEHPEIEHLVAGGFFRLAFTPAFYRRSKAQKKKIIALLRTERRDITLKELETRIKYGITAAQYEEFQNLKDITWKTYKFSYPEYLYVKKCTALKEYGKVRDFCELYTDYKRMVRELKKQKDDYWHFPKDLRKMHDKAVREVNALHVFQEQKKLEEKQQKYLAAVAAFTDIPKNFGAYEIGIPGSLAEWKMQADVLHQCIITAKYDEKVINNTCLIVFVRENGIPRATAQVYKNGNIGQFYADEKAKDIHPTEDIKKAFGQWHTLFMERVRETERLKETA